ncbi:MAG: hypothetical protein GXO23_04505 [Crenarchaeota archaeon]|nr:hypothetical protein [Thermoproteota archaeon]
MSKRSDVAFSKCVEDKLERCENFEESFNSCLEENNVEFIRKFLECESVPALVRDLLGMEECVSYHHYVIYYVARRCMSLTEEFRNVISKVLETLDNYPEDAEKLRDLISNVYSAYVDKVLRSVVRRDMKAYVELAILCDLLARLQIYYDCLSRTSYSECIPLLCSIRSRARYLL